jgi:hypothetical protein
MDCHFCGRTDIQARLGVSFHKKNGEPHNYHTIQRLRLIIANPETYVPLCRVCHHTVHHMMMHGFVWTEIDRLITEKRKETGEEKLKLLYEQMLKRLRRNAWMKKPTDMPTFADIQKENRTMAELGSWTLEEAGKRAVKDAEELWNPPMWKGVPLVQPQLLRQLRNIEKGLPPNATEKEGV